jgi:hypothetical protein
MKGGGSTAVYFFSKAKVPIFFWVVDDGRGRSWGRTTKPYASRVSVFCTVTAGCLFLKRAVRLFMVPRAGGGGGGCAASLLTHRSATALLSSNVFSVHARFYAHTRCAALRQTLPCTPRVTLPRVEVTPASSGGGGYPCACRVMKDAVVILKWARTHLTRLPARGARHSFCDFFRLAKKRLDISAAALVGTRPFSTRTRKGGRRRVARGGSRGRRACFLGRCTALVEGGRVSACYLFLDRGQGGNDVIFCR